MSHDVIGLDLGSSTVKAVVVRMAVRGAEVMRIETEAVALGEDGRASTAQVLEAASRLMQRLCPAPDAVVHSALSGELATVRRLVVPLSAAKQLEQVLRFEVDDVLPFNMDDAVLDYVEMGRKNGEISVVTVAALRARVGELIAQLEQRGISVREFGVAPLSYSLESIGLRPSEDEVVALVDLGHERTNISILDALSPTARTVLRGGRTLTEKIAETGGISFLAAESSKRTHGLTGSVGEILLQALRPLVREIQQTLKGHLAAGGRPTTRIVVCGGGSQLSGIERFLGNELGVPVSVVDPPLGPVGAMTSAEVRGTLVLAHALANRERVPRTKRIDMRRGELTFKGNYEFLKKRVGWLGVCALGLVLSWIFSSYVEYVATETEVEGQKVALAEKTKRLFGAEISDEEKIRELLNVEQAEKIPIPEKDAFDIVVELSRRIPPSVVHDVELLEIKPKRITLRGIVDAELKIPGQEGATTVSPEEGSVVSPLAQPLPEDIALADPVSQVDAGTELSPTDLITEKLLEFKECFTAIRVGKVTADGERRRYQMDIDSKCP